MVRSNKYRAIAQAEVGTVKGVIAMRRKPSAVIFDFFNTIVRRVNFDPEVGIRAILKHASKSSSISVHEVLGRNAILETQLSAVWDASEVWSTSQQFHRLLFDGLGISFDATPDEIERCFIEAAMEFERTEGIQRCLSGLCSRGLLLGVVANHDCTGESLRSVLSRLEIADPFRFVVSSADYGIGKPNLFIFEAAVAKLGAESATTWFVGDNLENDIAGANEAGLFSVWYNPDGKESGHIEPNATIRSWEEFEELVETVG
jgi:putative hydrolase of the HAD superfamily